MKNCGKRRSAGIGVLLLGMFLALPLSSVAQSETPQELFASGTQAARHGDHATALQQFNKALAAGMQTAALHYNIGVTYYWLGYLNQATVAFKRAARSPKMAGLAYYNLGLIAQDQDNPQLANEYFKRAEQAARTENLRKLSRHAQTTTDLEAISQQNQVRVERTSPPKAERGLLWLELSTGHDGNVLLEPEASNNASGEEDAFAGLMLFGYYHAAGDRQRGLRLYGLTLLDRHSDLNDFDLDLRGAGADYTVSTRQWRHNMDFMLLQSRLGGEELENIGRLALSSTTLLTGNLQLKFQLGYESIDASPAYSFLDGKRQTGEITLSGTSGDWKLEYSLENNDREDYSTENDEFQSFSPRRQELALTKHIRLGYAWELELKGAYKLSRYQDANVQPGGTLPKREDNHPSLGAALYKTWINDWRLGAELRYEENESNLDEADYTRRTFTLTLDKAFRF